jgi:anti-anti-sigma factor
VISYTIFESLLLHRSCGHVNARLDPRCPDSARIGTTGTPDPAYVSSVEPVGRRPGWDGHLLLVYEGEEQRRLGVAAWVRRGLDVGAKILYLEPHDGSHDRSLTSLVHDQPAALAAMSNGQIEIVPTDWAAYDLAWQADAVERALRGYPSVRVSAHTATAWDVVPRQREAETEQATDEVCRSSPVSVLCQYPARESLDLLALVSVAHGAGMREKLLQTAPLPGGGLALYGELDISNRDILRSVLLAATSTTTCRRFMLDLSALDFVDIGGIRTLVGGTEPYRRRGGQVLLQGAQPQVDRLLRLYGVDRERGLFIGELT